MASLTRMEQELYEQPARLRALLAQGTPAVQAAARELSAANPKWLMIAARGSSDNAARYAQYLFGVRQRLAVGLATPSLSTLYDSTPSLETGALIALSQSGRSPDIVACAAAARAQGQPAIVLTNEPESPLAKAATAVVPLFAGEERSVAATKTYTATLLGLALLSSALGPDAAATLDGVPEWVERMLALRAEVARVLPALAGATKLLIVARGFNYATAHELALKIKETSYLAVEAYSLADLLHGPVALVDEAATVLVIAPSGAAFADGEQAVAMLAARGARVVAMSDQQSLGAQAHGFVPLPPGVPEWLSPITAGVAAQLLAHDLACSLGRDPDAPRGLSKVTLTR